MQFTAHNILLGDGTSTMEGVPLLRDLQTWKAMQRTVDLHFARQNRGSVRVADLGCLEGGYAVEFARQGFDVTGIEARQENIDKCNYAADRLSLPNLKFAQDDVKNLAKYGEFDVIFCGGLLYHLDKPVEFINLLGRLTKKLLFLNTHYALPVDPLYDCSAPVRFLRDKVFGKVLKPAKNNYRLSKISTNENIEGRWFHEYAEEAPRDLVERSHWTAYSNSRSFWPTEKYLLQVLKESGFPILYQQCDFLEDYITDNYIERCNRNLYVCLKETVLA